MSERKGPIFVAGHRGLVGSAIVRRLKHAGLGDELLVAASSDLDLTDQRAVEDFFAEHRPVDFLADNLQIQTNVITSAHRHGCDKLLFLGSSCIYPKHAEQPMTEDALLSGPLEPTNQWYAIAKIAGIKLAQAFRRQHGFNAISLMPTNLYGPGDNFDLQSSLVLPALIRKCHEAAEDGRDRVTLWGSGTPRREFLHVDDLADACTFCMEHYDHEDILNVGTGEDIPIAELAAVIADVVGFEGEFDYDRSKPDGTPRKLLDVSRIHALGWRHRIDLREGITDTYAWYRQRIEDGVGLRV